MSYWAIIIPSACTLIGTIVGIVTANNKTLFRIEQLLYRIEQLEKKVAENNTISVEVAELKKDVAFIRENCAYHKKERGAKNEV